MIPDPTRGPYEEELIHVGTGVLELIQFRDLRFGSICELDGRPWYGTMDIQMEPVGKGIEFNQLREVVDHYTLRPTPQETLLNDMLLFFLSRLDVEWVEITIRAYHHPYLMEVGMTGRRARP